MAHIANCSTCNVLCKDIKLRASNFTPTLSSSFLGLSLDLHNHAPRLQSPKIRVSRAAAKMVVKDGVAEMAATEIEREKHSVKCEALRVGLICGGPSAERGISLNSARSVLDHIQVRRGTYAIAKDFSALGLICDR